jgi:adenylyltransferase/sulfurtransferase
VTIIKIGNLNNSEAKVMIEEISAAELKKLQETEGDVQLIDVRQPDEYAFARIPGAKLIPLGEIVRRMDELDETRVAILQCKMGGRSAKAIEILRLAGYKGEMKNLRGGITSWSNEVDPKVLKY